MSERIVAMNPDIDHSHCLHRERSLLLVDDEENISRSLVRLLKQDDYKIFTANSGRQGLEILKANEIGVIVSDQRMPEMSGTEFLCQVSKLYPASIRIVLSGYTELQSITAAINEGKIYKFLTKPWDDGLIRQNIKEAFRQYELEDENRRLSQELMRANEELRLANEKLAQNVKLEARSAQINLRSLQVAQGVLQNLPIGILGIDEELTIVLANDQANKILTGVGAGLIGNNLKDILPLELDACEKDKVICTVLNSGRSDPVLNINLIVHKYRMTDGTEVMVVVLMPVEGESHG